MFINDKKINLVTNSATCDNSTKLIRFLIKFAIFYHFDLLSIPDSDLMPVLYWHN